MQPKWIIADRVIDISDIWAEQTDPENERGEECFAYLHRVDVPCIDERHNCFTGAGFTLKGLRIREDATDLNTTISTYRNRDWAIKMLGADAVWRVEDSEMEAA